MLNSWNIDWNCLGGGIQYLLPTMIEPTAPLVTVPPVRWMFGFSRAVSGGRRNPGKPAKLIDHPPIQAVGVFCFGGVGFVWSAYDFFSTFMGHEEYRGVSGGGGCVAFGCMLFVACVDKEGLGVRYRAYM